MKPYTIPLSLAGAALIAAGGLAYLIQPEAGVVPAVNMAAGAAMVVAAGVINPDLFRHYGRWLNAFWGGIMVLGITVMVNFLADRYPQRLDVTAGKLHSLADLTVETLESMEKEVRVLAFVEKGEDQDLESLLKGYGVHSSLFSFELVDPDREPERTQRYGVQRYNTLVIETDDKRQMIEEKEEKEITSALLKALRDRSEVVYLTVGHGEAGSEGDGRALGTLRQRLEEIDYALRDSLFLGHAGEVPRDCAVLMIAGPRFPFLDPEVDAVRSYLERGGSVIAFLDPLYESGLEGLLKEWGVEVGSDFVIDTSGIGSLFGLDMTAPVAMSYGDHPITRKHRGVMTAFHLARSVQLAAAREEGFEGVELVETSEQGWAETDLSVLNTRGKRTVRLDEGVDRKGPVALGVAVSAPARPGAEGGRLVVFGDSDFATDSYFAYQGNGDLVLNTLSWLASDESLISIRPREAGHSPIALTERQGDWIFWVTVVLMPAAVALLGIFIVSRKGRWSLADLATAGLGLVIALFAVGLVNFVGNSYHLRIDLTKEGLFSLAEETRDLLEGLGEDDQRVSVKAFMTEFESGRFENLLREYGYASKNFDYEILDPQKNALEVKQYGVREMGTSVVEVSGDGRVRAERITEQSEEALSNAILKALNAREQKAYFSGGHQEGDLDLVDGEGYSMLKGRLEEMNFEVFDSLRVEEGIPSDATLLVVLAPRSPFSRAAADSVFSYLLRGKKALLLLDPGSRTGFERMLFTYQIELGQNFVVDLSGLGQFFGADVSVPVVVEYGDHPITEKIPQRGMSFFPLARSLNRMPFMRQMAGPTRPRVTPLAVTHKSSWGEKDLSPIQGGDGKVEFNEGEDTRGPLVLAAAVEAEPDTSVHSGEKTRFVVFGDADFARNQYFGQQVNGELLMSSVSWLSEREDKLTIPPREPTHTPITFYGNQGALLVWASVFVLPFAVALSGMVIVLRRGYESYASGFLSWLMYNFSAAAVFFFVLAVIGASEGDVASGEGYLLLSLVTAAIGYGLYRRAPWVWAWALALAVLHAGLGFLAIPNDTIQLLYAALFTVNAAILVWIRDAFRIHGDREVAA